MSSIHKAHRFVLFKVSALLCAAAFLLSGCVRIIVEKGPDGQSQTRVDLVSPTEFMPSPQEDAPPLNAPQSTPQADSIAQMEAKSVALINREREKRGLSTLSTNTTLTKVAREYSALMGTQKFFSHYDAEGKSVADRVESAGIRYRMVGENLFTSTNAPTPVDLAVEGWMKSDSHRKNILTPEYTQTGIGVWRKGNEYYFTQIFLLPR